MSPPCAYPEWLPARPRSDHPVEIALAFSLLFDSDATSSNVFLMQQYNHTATHRFVITTRVIRLQMYFLRQIALRNFTPLAEAFRRVVVTWWTGGSFSLPLLLLGCRFVAKTRQRFTEIWTEVRSSFRLRNTRIYTGDLTLLHAHLFTVHQRTSFSNVVQETDNDIWSSGRSNRTSQDKWVDGLCGGCRLLQPGSRLFPVEARLRCLEHESCSTNPLQSRSSEPGGAAAKLTT